MVKHFEIPLPRSEDELRLTRENYICTTRDGRYYLERGRLRKSPEEWDAVREGALRNYDLTMCYCERLRRDDFEHAIERLPEEFPVLEPVDDLTDWTDVPGVYVLVLDDYKQAYVGLARSRGGIRQRIVVHWQRKLAFNRLLAGAPEQSILSIDSFRALDTTRILAARVGDGPDAAVEAARLECAVFESVPEAFLCNRTAAGDLPGGLHEAIARRRYRRLA